GVNPDPEDATLHRLAAGLARTGVVTVIPRSSRLLAGIIAPEEVEVLVSTFQYLEGLSYVDADRVGFAGFCVGASLSALAAADPRIADRVAFVNFFGGYFDARDVIRAVGTRQMREGGAVSPWTPHPMTVQVFARYLLPSLTDEHDRAVLEQVF